MTKKNAPDYGRAHRDRRARWARRIAAGGVNCARCGESIEPNESWDLGHDDSDPERRRYSGPEHSRCNRATRAHLPSRKREPEAHPGLLA